MRIVAVIPIVMVVISQVKARPEPPGYSYSAPSGPVSSYNPPSTNYGAPAPKYGPPAQPPTVHKHVYVHVPPPEPEYHAPRKPIEFAPAQKHYKIIFIKAPTAPTPTAPVIPVQPQNEEKTLVYVLVKKPEEQPDIVVPTPAPTQPSKPEVYFIRYKTQKEEGYPDRVPSPQYGAPNPPSSSYGAP
ncbi:uncharacterized protein [Onthophagus taurus]|uniref:uncharacterized protein n=1 Tax=Onthophagus taurus TaxID=166361 RepID=UPI000C20F4DB|nr:pollen-specific leucine-rich repeat extensin-like protein 4 [Onthophagus taurus]